MVSGNCNYCPGNFKKLFMDARIVHLEHLYRTVKVLSNSNSNYLRVLELYHAERNSEDIISGAFSYHNNLFNTGWKAKEPFEDIMKNYDDQKMINDAYLNFINEFLCDINSAILFCRMKSNTYVKKCVGVING